MKTLLLAVNLLLAALVVWSAAKRFGAIAGGPQVEYTVKKTPRTQTVLSGQTTENRVAAKQNPGSCRNSD